MKIGVVFGNPEVTTGGRALKFYASVRLDIRKVETLTEEDESVGNLVRVKVVKNKVAPPFRKCEFVITFGTGIDIMKSLAQCAVDVNIIQRSGAWYSYGEERIGQGMKKAVAFLEKNPKMCEAIVKRIKE